MYLGTSCLDLKFGSGPIIAMHLNDARDGTNVAEEILSKYKTALEDKGMISRDDLYSLSPGK